MSVLPLIMKQDVKSERGLLVKNTTLNDVFNADGSAVIISLCFMTMNATEI